MKGSRGVCVCDMSFLSECNKIYIYIGKKWEFRFGTVGSLVSWL